MGGSIRIVFSIYLLICLFCLGQGSIYAQSIDDFGGETGVVSSVPQIVVDYPESEYSVSLLESVSVVGKEGMTYCSFITKTNLQRFTGLPISNTFGELGSILEGDAIRLIEAGLDVDMLYPVNSVSTDMKGYFGKIPEYTLFDMYMYTSNEAKVITEQDYLFQGHRVILLYAQKTWWVMDPLRGSGELTRQQRDLYKQYVSVSTQLFVYAQSYVFAPEYVFDLPAGKNSSEEATDLSSLIYQGIIVPELDTEFMPIASTFLKPVMLMSSGAHLSFPVGVVIKSDDMTPFNIGLLHVKLRMSGKNMFTLNISLSGKELFFNMPLNAHLDVRSLLESMPGGEGEFIIKRVTGGTVVSTTCNDQFNEQEKKLGKADAGTLPISICRTGTYEVTRIPSVDNA